MIDRRPDDGRAFKCTFCYDRQKAGLQPACATACPTESILFGEIDDLRERAANARIETARHAGSTTRSIYDPRETSVGGIHAMFIVRGDPRRRTTCRRAAGPDGVSARRLAIGGSGRASHRRCRLFGAQRAAAFSQRPDA